MKMATTTSPAPSGSARLGRLESQVEEQGQIIRTMKRELEEVTRRLGSVQGSSVELSDFLSARSMVSRHDTEIISLRQTAMSAPAPTQDPTEKLYLPLYSDHST